MAHTLSNPDGLYDPTPFGYSHLAIASGELVFVAGQFASDAEGHVKTADFAEQVALSLDNLHAALRAAGVGFEHVVQLRTFIVDHDMAKLAVIGEQIGKIWGDRPPTQTLTGVASLALPEMLFEIDAVAVRP